MTDKITAWQQWKFPAISAQRLLAGIGRSMHAMLLPRHGICSNQPRQTRLLLGSDAYTLKAVRSGCLQYMMVA